MKTNIRKSNRKRSRKHGFLTRMKTRGGRDVIRRRRRLGRKLSAKKMPKRIGR